MSGESKKVHVSQLKTSRLDDEDHENDVLLYWPVVENEQSNDVINDNVNDEPTAFQADRPRRIKKAPVRFSHSMYM